MQGLSSILPGYSSYLYIQIDPTLFVCLDLLTLRWTFLCEINQVFGCMYVLVYSVCLILQICLLNNQTSTKTSL